MWNKIGKIVETFFTKNYFRSERSTLVYCGCFVRVQIDFTQIEAKQKKERKGETENPIARRDFFDKKRTTTARSNPFFLSFANSISQNPM